MFLSALSVSNPLFSKKKEYMYGVDLDNGPESVLRKSRDWDQKVAGCTCGSDIRNETSKTVSCIVTYRK